MAEAPRPGGATPGRWHELYRDAEACAAADALLAEAPMPVAGMHRRLVERFGEARAPSYATLTRYVSLVRDGDDPNNRPPKTVIPPGRAGPINRDAEMRAAADALLAEAPMPVAGMHRRLVERFGEARAPSRSALYRHIRRGRLGIGYRSPRLWGIRRDEAPR
jgi:hypothetical protein